MYVVPIVVPFVAYLLDRGERWSERNKKQKLIDAIVVLIARRVIGNVPFVSGHTLFLSYCIITSRSLVARLTALIVMAQTVYLKYFVWHDWVTSTSGIVLGCVAAIIAWQMEDHVMLRANAPLSARIRKCHPNNRASEAGCPPCTTMFIRCRTFHRGLKR